MGQDERDDAPAPGERRIEQLRALLTRLEANGGDDAPTRAVRSLLDEAERARGRGDD